MREGSAGRRGHLSSVLPLFLSPLYVFRGAQSSDLRGGQQQSLTDECFLNISCAHQKRVCLCVFVFEKGGRSPGGSGGVSVTQSGCDHCQAHENGVRERERRRVEMEERQHKDEKSSVLPVT